MPKVLPISACLLIKNEADRLEACLKAIEGRFGQVIAYDNGSTDNSIEILKRHGVEVIEGPWLGFSETRRVLWAMAKYDWIFWLDADEIFTPETLDAMERVGKTPRVGGYRVCRQVVFEGRAVQHGDWFPDWVLRVFRKDGFTMNNRLVHESVEVPGDVESLPGIVAHYSFRNWADLVARSQRYAQLWAQQAQKDRKRPGWPLLRAVWKFIRGYFIKSGWRDGEFGTKIAIHNAREVFDKYRNLQRAYRN